MPGYTPCTPGKDIVFDNPDIPAMWGADVPSPYDENPQMDDTASPGISAQYSRGDHIHPSDVTRQPVTLSSPITIGGVVQSTVEDALSALAIETFSTSETLTNKVWIDGKPIYRKVIKWESSLASGVNEIGSVPNIGELVSASITARNSAGTAWKDNNTGASNDLGVSVDVPGGRVVLFTEDAWSSPVVIVILEYTKAGT